MREKPEIAVFGANPAWQKNLSFPFLIPGKVNRSCGMKAYAAGKGINFCRAARCGGLCTTAVYQFAGGKNGEKLEEALRNEGLRFVSVSAGGETRCCMTCLDQNTGTVTELIEPSHPVPAYAEEEMLALWKKGLSGANGCAITGSLPDGSDPALYRKIAEPALKENLPLLVDAVNGIEPILSLTGKIILKINGDELKKLTGGSSAEEALRSAMNRWPEIVFAITDGAGDAFAGEKQRIFRYRLPEIKVLNPIGSGDTCSALLLSHVLTGKSIREAFAFALAAASANCLDPESGHFDPAVLPALMPEVTELSL